MLGLKGAEMIDLVFDFLDKIIVNLDKAGLPASLCCVGPVSVVLVIWELITGNVRRSLSEDIQAD